MAKKSNIIILGRRVYAKKEVWCRLLATRSQRVREATLVLLFEWFNSSGMEFARLSFVNRTDYSAKVLT